MPTSSPNINQNILIETIFQHIPQLIFWKNLHSVYLGCNHKYAQLLGLNHTQDIVGKTDDQLGWLPDGDTADKFRSGDQATLSGEYLTNAEEWLSLPNGTKILTLVNKVPLYDDAGNICGVLGVATDITDKKIIEENLIKTRHQLQGMTLVSASIAHELRTPLATIKNAIISVHQYLPALIDHYETTRPAPHAQAAATLIPRKRLALLKTVVNSLSYKVDQANQVMDMLLINLSEHHHHTLPTDICSAKKCIDAALTQYIFPAKNKPNIHWDAEDDFSFQAKQILIVHVLFNLLKNALYFIDKAGKGAIYIWLEHGETSNAIHFKDTSLGIKPEHLPHIFEPFFTADTNKGTGIGLAFCRTIVNAYGGSIYCDALYHEYTEFVLHFPKKIFTHP